MAIGRLTSLYDDGVLPTQELPGRVGLPAVPERKSEARIGQEDGGSTEWTHPCGQWRRPQLGVWRRRLSAVCFKRRYGGSSSIVSHI